MIYEHAITFADRPGISSADLDYLVRKANRLGKSGRDIARIFMEEDAEGTHVYFECTSLQNAQDRPTCD